MTLAEFLLARITDREKQAPPEHHAPFEREWEWCPAALTEPYGDHEPGPCDCGGPKRRAVWLAECEAKRRIVDLISTYRDSPVPRLTLCLLALPYADHPDYRQEWKP